MTARSLRRHAILAVLGACALVILVAAPASAHAILESSTPVNGESLGSPPKSVALTFDEAVGMPFGAIRLYNSSGNRLDAGPPFHPAGKASSVQASMPELGRGTYVVTWRVISADTHPVQGAFTFSVGVARVSQNTTSGLAARVLRSEGGSKVVGVVFGAIRTAMFASMALLVGSVVFLVALWPEGRRRRGARRLVYGGAIALAAFSLAGFLIDGPYAGGLPIVKAFDPSLWREVLRTRFGEVWLGRTVLALAAVPLIAGLRAPPGEGRPRRMPAWWLTAAGLLGLAILVTPSLSGHASVGMWVPFAVPADVVHVGGMSVWLGELAALAVALRIADVDVLERVVPRYSRVALGAVLAIVASGVFQTFRQVDRLGAMWDTEYGRILSVKILVFVVLLGVAAYSRDKVHRTWLVSDEIRAWDQERVEELVGAGVGGAGVHDHPAGGADVADRSASPDAAAGSNAPPREPLDADDAAWVRPYVLDPGVGVRRLRRSVWAELALGLAVVVAASLLMNSRPARSVDLSPFLQTIKAPTLWVQATIDPTRPGPNQLHIFALKPDGLPAQPLQITAELSNSGRGIAPIPVRLLRAGPGHMVSVGFVIPFTGTWQVTVRSLTSPIDEVPVQFQVKVR